MSQDQSLTPDDKELLAVFIETMAQIVVYAGIDPDEVLSDPREPYEVIIEALNKKTQDAVMQALIDVGNKGEL